MKRYIRQYNEITIKDIFSLTTEQMRNFIEQKSSNEKLLLNVLISEWSASDGRSSKAAKAMKNLLPLTLNILSKYHPGEIEIYRGQEKEKVSGVRSFTSNEKIAKSFGKNIIKFHITHSIPALSLDKFLGKDKSENEIIINVK